MEKGKKGQQNVESWFSFIFTSGFATVINHLLLSLFTKRLIAIQEEIPNLSKTTVWWLCKEIWWWKDLFLKMWLWQTFSHFSMTSCKLTRRNDSQLICFVFLSWIRSIWLSKQQCLFCASSWCHWWWKLGYPRIPVVNSENINKTNSLTLMSLRGS